jgi:alanine dehydrogenase
VIIGAGVLGFNAARAFLGLGAQVIVMDKDVGRLQRVDDLLNGRVTTMLATRHSLRRVTEFADVIVGAIQLPGRRAEQLVTHNMVRRMRPGSVIIDFAIDHGGCVETSRPTTLRDPVFISEQVIHYCVPNAPAAVARTTSYGLTNALLPVLRDIGEVGIIRMLEHQPGFAHGIVLYQGKLANPDVAAALGLQVATRIPYGGGR